MIQIRWHGRGGQGVVTAAKTLAAASLKEGLYFRASPEYGPERMGAPVRAFNRISKNPIYLSCDIKEPDIVVVLDPTLIGQVNVCEGLKKGGKLLLNSSKSAKVLKEELGLKDVKVYRVDANKISYEELGRVLPNTCMLGALLKAEHIISLQTLIEEVEEDFSKKFKPEIVKKNISAIKRAYEEVEEDA